MRVKKIIWLLVLCAFIIGLSSTLFAASAVGTKCTKNPNGTSHLAAAGWNKRNFCWAL